MYVSQVPRELSYLQLHVHTYLRTKVNGCLLMFIRTIYMEHNIAHRLRFTVTYCRLSVGMKEREMITNFDRYQIAP